MNDSYEELLQENKELKLKLQDLKEELSHELHVAALNSKEAFILAERDYNIAHLEFKKLRIESIIIPFLIIFGFFVDYLTKSTGISIVDFFFKCQDIFLNGFHFLFFSFPFFGFLIIKYRFYVLGHKNNREYLHKSIVISDELVDAYESIKEKRKVKN